MKSFTIDPMGNQIPAINKPDKGGNLPKYNEEMIRKRPNKPKPPKEPVSIITLISEAEKFMK